MDIKEALKNLDPENNEHWTKSNLPNLATLEEFIGGPINDEMLKSISKYDREKARSLSSSSDDKLDLSKDLPEKSNLPDEELIKELRTKTQKLGVSITKLNKNLNKTQSDIAEKTVELNLLEAKIDELLPVSTSQQEIMNYLKSENKQRIKRYENREKILKSLDPKDFPAHSPLDMAMAHKKQRGTHRPIRI